MQNKMKETATREQFVLAINNMKEVDDKKKQEYIEYYDHAVPQLHGKIATFSRHMANGTFDWRKFYEAPAEFVAREYGLEINPEHRDGFVKCIREKIIEPVGVEELMGPISANVDGRQCARAMAAIVAATAALAYAFAIIVAGAMEVALSAFDFDEIISTADIMSKLVNHFGTFFGVLHKWPWDWCQYILWDPHVGYCRNHH